MFVPASAILSVLCGTIARAPLLHKFPLSFSVFSPHGATAPSYFLPETGSRKCPLHICGRTLSLLTVWGCLIAGLTRGDGEGNDNKKKRRSVTACSDGHSSKSAGKRLFHVVHVEKAQIRKRLEDLFYLLNKTDSCYTEGNKNEVPAGNPHFHRKKS